MNVEFPLEKPVKRRGIWSRLQIGAQVDDEADELLSAEQQKLKLLENNDRRSRYAFRAALLTLIVITSVFSFMGFLIWRLVTYCDTFRISIEPAAKEVISLTASMVRSTESTLTNVMKTSHAAHVLTSHSLGNIIEAVNHTAAMVEHIERMVEHPAFQLSLLPSGGR